MSNEELQAQCLERAIEKARSIYVEATRQQASPPERKSAEKPTEPRAALLSVPIKSKLGLEPSDHHLSRPRASEEPLPNSNRARSRRRSTW